MRKRFVVNADDDMANSHGTEATIAREHGKAFIDAPTCNLERTFDNLASSAEGNGNERKQQAHECGRQRPSVSSNDENALHDRTHCGLTKRIDAKEGIARAPVEAVKWHLYPFSESGLTN